MMTEPAKPTAFRSSEASKAAKRSSTLPTGTSSSTNRSNRISARWKTILNQRLKDDPTLLSAYEVYFALYRQLVGDDDEALQRALCSRLLRPIIVDECRAARQKKGADGAASSYFSSATQIGMTAPQETKYVSNISASAPNLHLFARRDRRQVPRALPRRQYHARSAKLGKPGQVDKFETSLKIDLRQPDFREEIVLEDWTQSCRRSPST